MRFLQSPPGWYFLAFLSGILLSLAWPSSGFAPLLFIALVPLIFVEDIAIRLRDRHSPWLFFGSAYFCFFTFNLLTTWWVKYASLFGAVAAIVCNALFMALVFQLWHFTRSRLRGVSGYVALPVYWISFEWLHLDWDLSWPWLTLGNGFAGWVKMIQWYEFTGVLGGTLWVLVINILLYVTIKQRLFFNVLIDYRRTLFLLLLIIAVPLMWSVYRYHSYREQHNPVSIAVIQPNIDPYNEKFSGMSSDAQLKRILELAAEVTNDSTDFIVAPETALPDGMWEENLSDQHQVRQLRRFADEYPRARWVIGLSSHKFYPDSNHRSATARKFTQQDGYYDSYNTAMQIDRDGVIQLHHKSKLVPGVEKMPFPEIFKHIDKFAIDLGGISGSLGVQDTPSVFTNHVDDHVVAPVICYESIYGAYLAKYIRKGASLIFIITNDGWWSDTPGYRQHLKYATLRAIEARRSIARSANTGISCFINQRGDILQATAWWVPAFIKAEINASDIITFYVRFGDYTGVAAVAAACFLLLLTLSPFGKRRHTSP
jgi:apolipoprotein N-acyltransferase